MTAASPAPLALLLSCNDLEALAAADLAARHGVAVHDLALNWGERPDAVLDRIEVDRLPQAVILVEAPGRLEERLSQTGRTVYRIDHHSYVDPVTRRLDDRSSPLSSLEQVAALLGAALSPVERWIAANDRGFWPGLWAALAPQDAQDALAQAEAEAGAAPAWLTAGLRFLRSLQGIDPRFTQSPTSGAACLAVALAIRLREAAVRRAFATPQGPDAFMEAAAADLRAALAWVDQQGKSGSGRLLQLGDRCGDWGTEGRHQESLWLAAAPGTVAPLIADALSLRTAIAAIAAGRAPRPVPLLCLSMPAGNPTAEADAETDAEPASLFWSGSGEDWPLVREWMAALADPENPAVPAPLSRLTVWAGGSADSCFWGAKPAAGESGSAALSELADLWLDTILGLARPLRSWSLRFFQVLD